jgi:death on curing protein
MSRTVSISRLAKSSGLDPDRVALALIERGVDIDDPEQPVDGTTHKAARAVIREMLGGPRVVRAMGGPAPSVLEPAKRSHDLIGMLSVEDILLIHDRLCADFASTQDPIDPPGVRSMSLLASAVARQGSGYEDQLKYPDPVLNAATLLFGICCDHPFHNGNKRTALVATLAHFDRNRRVLTATRQRDLFRLMLAVASHTVVERSVKIGRKTELVGGRGTPDEEVLAIAKWFGPRIQKITRGEAQITYRELRQILDNFGFMLGPSKNMKVAICRKDERGGLFGRRRPKTLMAISWPSEGRTVSINEIKHIRKTLRLCEEDGVTSDVFYERGIRIDRFINDYRLVLHQLASQ